MGDIDRPFISIGAVNFCPSLKRNPGKIDTGAGHSGKSPVSSTPPFTIFIRAGTSIRKAKWQGGTFETLRSLCFETYGIQIRVNTALAASELPDSPLPFGIRNSGDGYEHSVKLEDLQHLKPGSMVEVENPLWKALFTLSVMCKGLPHKVKSHIEQLEGYMTDDSSARGLTLAQSIDNLLNEPQSSTFAMILAIIIMGLIFISTVVFCLETLPEIYDPGDKFTVWVLIETICIACFTLEISLKFIVSPDKKEFARNLMNIVDFVSILPFYLERIFSSIQIPGLSVLRVMRLSRVFRLLKVSRDSIQVLAKTMKKSSKPLYILVFLSALAMVVFASLMYYCERGQYDDLLGVWMIKSGYMCPYECTSVSLPDCPEIGHLATALYTQETGEYKSDCQTMFAQSVFDSIPRCCWWALVTMTTVGYGDMSPVTVQGKALGMVTQMFGILVIALPVTIIGSNFTTIYERVAADKSRENRMRGLNAACQNGGHKWELGGPRKRCSTCGVLAADPDPFTQDLDDFDKYHPLDPRETAKRAISILRVIKQN